MKRAIILCLMLGGCAGYSRVASYPLHLPSNYESYSVRGVKFNIKRHETDDTILIQPTVLRSAGAGMLAGFTMGGASTNAAIYPQYRAAAEAYAVRHRCTVKDLYPIGQVSFEAALVCEKRPD